MKTYKIIRMFEHTMKKDKVIKTGLTLEQAQTHCKDSKTKKEGEWFDGYLEE